MSRNEKFVIGLLSALVIVMLAGESMIYLANPYSYDSDMNGNEYTVSSSVSADFRVVQFTFRSATEEIFIYFDEEYETLTGTSLSDAEDMKEELRLRGRSSEIVGAQELKTVVQTHDASKAALVFIDGSLPDTVYTGHSSDPIFTWFANGGSVCYVGPTIGQHYSTKETCVDLGDAGVGCFLPTTEIGDGKESIFGTVADAGIGKQLCIRSSVCTYGLKNFRPDTLSLGYVSEDGYCAAAITKYSNGQLTVIGNLFNDVSRSDLSQILASGITYSSSFMERHDVHCRHDSKSGTVSNVPDTGVFIFCGGDYTCYGRSYGL